MGNRRATTRTAFSIVSCGQKQFDVGERGMAAAASRRFAAAANAVAGCCSLIFFRVPCLALFFAANVVVPSGVTKVLVGSLRPVIARGVHEYLAVTRFAEFAVADHCIDAPKGFANRREAILAQVLLSELEDL